MALATCPFCDSGLAWNNCSCKYAIMAQRRGLIEAKRVFFADGSPRTITKPKPDHTKGARLISSKIAKGPIDDHAYREGTKEQVEAALAAEAVNRDARKSAQAGPSRGHMGAASATQSGTDPALGTSAANAAIGVTSPGEKRAPKSRKSGNVSERAPSRSGHSRGAKTSDTSNGRERLSTAAPGGNHDVLPGREADNRTECSGPVAETENTPTAGGNERSAIGACNDRVAKPAAPAPRKPGDLRPGRVSLDLGRSPRGKGGKRKPPEASQAEPVGVEPKRPGPAGGAVAAAVVDTPRATRGRRSLLAPRGQCSFCDLRWEADTARMRRHRNKETVE